MISGKFKKDLLTHIQNINFLENFENFGIIPFDEFLIIFNNKGNKLKNLDDVLSLLEILNKYRTITKNNLGLVNKQCTLIENLIDLLKYNTLLSEKKLMEKELKISQIKAKSSDIAAKTDLLNKLTISLKQSKQQLNYLEEDYIKIKNQKDNILKEINNLNQEIMDLNRIKKECFNQINKITRGMDDITSEDNDSENRGISKSEKIKSLQLKSKEVQFKIKQIKSKIQDSQLKYENFKPKYEKIEKDYQTMESNLNSDKEKIQVIKNELEKGLKIEENDDSITLDFNKLNLIKPTKIIQNEINTINDQLITIKKSIHYLNDEDPKDFIDIAREIKKMNETLKNDKNRINIPEEREYISKIIDKFEIVDTLIKKIENIINKFLIEINLKCIFNLDVKEDNKNFLINIQFVRSNKEKIEFQDLTTPEKIFFILCFHISIQMHLELNDIIFANLFINDKYNKRGSIFRTIRKLIPIFKNDPKFQDYRLIFILSNFELKDQIEYLKVVNI